MRCLSTNSPTKSANTLSGSRAKRNCREYTMEMLRALCTTDKPNPDLSVQLTNFKVVYLKAMVQELNIRPSKTPKSKEDVIQVLSSWINKIVQVKTNFFSCDQLITYHIQTKSSAAKRQAEMSKKRERSLKRRRNIENRLLVKNYYSEYRLF
eukprot:TRINITY_DN22486_c0_g1_i1.p1 TRINITY_DN22486_c0_g1~~TRINITY_DN22486_c0_g1_i1.p1  ORF type:complete len:152 (-),score=12.67 TRINITY_DN22486_c0_g1_i1:5-460(-)